MSKIFALFLQIVFAATACQSDTKAPPAEMQEVTQPEIPVNPTPTDTVAPKPSPTESQDSETKSAAPSSPSSGNLPGKTSGANDTAIKQNGFTDLAALDPTIRLDIKYATADNFTKSKIYDCPRCLLRPEAAEAIVKANKVLKNKGLSLKMFDCYRPRPYQQRLWDKVPDPNYVTPPAKGSMHSRGAAVDLTIVDAQGRELDMGTPYDFFGEAAHTDYKRLSAQVLENRALLRKTLEAVGFIGIRTEWWHFSYQKRQYALSDYLWPCPKEKE